jgi:DNA repair exonuclease SbcCD nuclease subunit
MKKFVHSGDLHFGASRQLHPGYLRRQLHAMRAVYNVAERENADCVVWSGDIFDNTNVRPPERDAFLKELLRMDKRGFTTLIVDGNHDEYFAGYSNIHFLRLLYEAHRFKHTIIAEGAPEWVTIAGQEFLLFPWHRDAAKTLVKESRRHRTPPVVVLHLALKGAKADNGYPLPTGEELDPRVHACYVALGDLHLCQRPIKAMPHMWYCGAPIQHDFGETLPKGCLVVEPTEPTKPRFVPLDLKPQLLTVRSLAEHRRAEQDNLFRLIAEHAIEKDERFPQNIVKIDYRFDASRVKVLKRRARGQADEIRHSPLYGLEAVLREVAGLHGRPLKLALTRGYRYFNTLARAGEGGG